jgi:2,3-bisphosphoglycerate-dependent phosphoglycerate mutase
MTTTPDARIGRRAFLGLAGLLAIITSLPVLADGAPLQIWFIRHGESEINVAGAKRPVPDDGVSYPLTRKGVEQARALAASLSGMPITKIYSSTRLRAIQTADAVGFEHTMPLVLAPEAVEINFGTEPSSPEQGRAMYQDLMRRWFVEKDWEARLAGGESFSDVQRRFLPFVREVMNRHALDSGVVAIVAHGATLGYMVPVLATNVPSDFALRHPLPNTGIIKTELRDSRLFCTEWAGIASTRFGE